MPHFIIGDDGILTEIPDIFDTVSEAELSGANIEDCFVRETLTQYIFLINQPTLAVNHLSVLETGEGGNTRWVGISGKHVEYSIFPVTDSSSDGFNNCKWKYLTNENITVPDFSQIHIKGRIMTMEGSSSITLGEGSDIILEN